MLQLNVDIDHQNFEYIMNLFNLHHADGNHGINLIIHVIFMTFCQLLIAVLCYLKMLLMREGS